MSRKKKKKNENEDQPRSADTLEAIGGEQLDMNPSGTVLHGYAAISENKSPDPIQSGVSENVYNQQAQYEHTEVETPDVSEAAEYEEPKGGGGGAFPTMINNEIPWEEILAKIAAEIEDQLNDMSERSERKARRRSERIGYTKPYSSRYVVGTGASRKYTSDLNDEIDSYLNDVESINKRTDDAYNYTGAEDKETVFDTLDTKKIYDSAKQIMFDKAIGLWNSRPPENIRLINEDQYRRNVAYLDKNSNLVDELVKQSKYSPIEQVLAADSMHLMAKPTENSTQQDAYNLEQNLKLLGMLDDAEAITDAAVARIKHVVEQDVILQQQACSTMLGLPDLSHITQEWLDSAQVQQPQKPYSRIPRGFTPSRGGLNRNPILAQIPPMPMPGELNSYDTSKNGKTLNEMVNDYKTKERKPLIIKYRDVIKDEAKRYSIPPEMIAGIIWNETPKILGLGKTEYEEKKLLQGLEATIGIAQISPYSALVEKTVGFKPEKYSEYIKTYNKANSSQINNIYELKVILKDYYLGKINDPKILHNLSVAFKQPFINDKELIKLRVKNETNLIKSDTYSIKYLADLLNRVRLEKGFPKGSKWTDEEIKAVVHEYNKNRIPFLEGYNESIYNNLNNLRRWLK